MSVDKVSLPSDLAVGRKNLITGYIMIYQQPSEANQVALDTAYHSEELLMICTVVGKSMTLK